MTFWFPLIGDVGGLSQLCLGYYGFYSILTVKPLTIWSIVLGDSPLVTTGSRMDHTRVEKLSLDSNGIYLLLIGNQFP